MTIIELTDSRINFMELYSDARHQCDLAARVRNVSDAREHTSNALALTFKMADIADSEKENELVERIGKMIELLLNRIAAKVA